VIPESIRLGNEFYVLASALAPRRPQVLLNHEDSFAIFDVAGDIPLAVLEAYGLFHQGTRFLNRFDLRLNGTFPILLSTIPSSEGSELMTYLSNADKMHEGEIILPRDTVSVQRCKTLFSGVLYERLQLHHFGQQPLKLELVILFGADFADIFELRGTGRNGHGEVLGPLIEPDCIRLPYRGLDGVHRETVLVFSQAPDQLDAKSARFQLGLKPGQETSLQIRIECHVGERGARARDFGSALAAIREERGQWSALFPALHSDNSDFNAWLNRSLQDLALLWTQTEGKSYVYAGIPWFATVFGRDGLITALETLAFMPELAAGTLRTLAALQGQEYNAERDEEPGKILHEMRHGEMAATGEIPFGRYYGSVDATPLFLMLLAQYTARTGDLALARELWPHALAAMHWIDCATSADSAGYLTYARHTPRGLINQGWKDSHDAISHEDGALAEVPIALAEVQAYVYAARRGLARTARQLGYLAEADTWERQAAEIHQRFNRDFWLPEEDTYALALDGDQRPCRVVSSNVGHCLFAGIADADKAQRVITRLFRDDMFCGWGIRTLSAQARRYNPMSYHNGSVWPHDNALIGLGCTRYGATDRASQLLTGLFDASTKMAHRRLPELFCGFPRLLHHSPVPYPVACKPQAWSAGSVFLLVQAALGLGIDGWTDCVTFDRMILPQGVNRLDIRKLRVRNGWIDLTIIRDHSGTAVKMIGKQGTAEIVVRH
jgi:glycogen debranching enzyme